MRTSSRPCTAISAAAARIPTSSQPDRLRANKRSRTASGHPNRYRSKKMDTFQFSRPTTVDQAVQLGATSSTAQQSAEVRFVAGGTTLIDLMKLNVERPKQIVDINVLPLVKIDTAPNVGLIIAALARNSDLGHNTPRPRTH